MDDIVERLRKQATGMPMVPGLPWRAMLEAADEIDRLRESSAKNVGSMLAAAAALDRTTLLLDSLTAERDKLQDQCNRLTGEVAGMKRFRFEEAEKSDATIAALRERVAVLEQDAARYRATLLNVRLALDVANTTPNGPICDTIWYSNHETLFDYIDAALKGEA